MKHVSESLKHFNDYKFFKILEEESSEKTSMKQKEKDGLAIIDKLVKNFDEFKKQSKGEILKYKEFWEENTTKKEAFSEVGNIYKMFDRDYVVGVLDLPVETLPDGTIEGGLGGSLEPEEVIIEGKELNTNPLQEAEETETDLDLDLDVPEETDTKSSDEEEVTDDTEKTNVEDPIDVKTPQKYFVVYDISGDEREEIFRCGSNNVIKAFDEFYRDTFKGSMKNIIAQYHKIKQEEKTKVEKKEKEKKQTEKQSKVEKFLKESMQSVNEWHRKDTTTHTHPEEVLDFVEDDLLMMGYTKSEARTIVDKNKKAILDYSANGYADSEIVDILVNESINEGRYDRSESHPLDDLKANYRSWEYDHDNVEDAEELLRDLMYRHPDFDEDELRELAYSWVGIETPSEIEYKRDHVYHGRSEIPPQYQ